MTPDEVESTISPVRSANTYRSLGEALLRDEGVRGLVDRLAAALGRGVALVDLRGNMLAVAPARSAWPVDALRGWRPGHESTELAQISVRPVTLGEDVVALLCVRDVPVDDELTAFAAGLISADIARRQADAAGRRELLGQVIDDVIRGMLSEREGERRLAALGIDRERPLHVLVGRVTADARRLRSFPWNLQALLAGLDEPFIRAVIGDRVVMLVAAGPAVARVAQSLLDHLGNLGQAPRVGLGGAYSGIAGIRLSYLEAAEASTGRPGVHEATKLNLGRLLIVADLGLPLRDLAERVLRPLIAHDAQHSASLMQTLRAWFDNDCAPGPTADQLFLHRNTLRYRLSLVEKLLDSDLSSFATRMHVWFALSCLDPRGATAWPQGPGSQDGVGASTSAVSGPETSL